MHSKVTILTINLTVVGYNRTRILVKTTLTDAMLSYPALGIARCGSDSDQSWKSAIGEPQDIVGSLFTLAEALNEVQEKLHSLTNPAIPAIMESHKNCILDRFPNAGIDLVVRFVEGNTECHQPPSSQAGVLGDQARPKARYYYSNSDFN